MLAIDLATLFAAAFPSEATRARAAIPSGAGIVARMQAAATLLRACGADAVRQAADHPSDVVRGWAAYACAQDAAPDTEPATLLDALRPFAADPHFGVREWFWMAARPPLAARLASAIAALRAWTADPDPNLRRFAAEVLRPRGVWCAHLPELVADPARGLPLLEPLRADPARYVRDSVANWLNDAAKARPDWVDATTSRWLAESPGPDTASLVRRARRSLAPERVR